MAVESLQRPNRVDDVMSVESSDADRRVRQRQKHQTLTERHAVDRPVSADWIVVKVENA